MKFPIKAEKLTIRYDSSVPFQDEETLRPTFIKLLRENRTKDLIKKQPVPVLTEMTLVFTSMT